MSKHIYIHAGPYKTGSTAIQHWICNNEAALTGQEWLYPKSGLTRSRISNTRSGPRHYHLFQHLEPSQHWEALTKEIDETRCRHIILSAERICANPEMLRTRKRFFSKHKATLVLVVRRESDMLRSMYLQVIKSRSQRGWPTIEKPYRSFSQYYDFKRDSFCYLEIVRPWIESFGPDSVLYIPYRRTRNFDIVEEFLATLGISGYTATPQAKRHNKSISPLEATIIHASERLFPSRRLQEYSTRIGLKMARIIPNADKKWALSGHNEQEINDYYAKKNKELFDTSEGFRQAHYEAHKLPE